MKDYTTSPKQEKCIHTDQKEHLRGMGMIMDFISLSCIKMARHQITMYLNYGKQHIQL